MPNLTVFDFYDNKIEPWRYRNDDFKGFHE